MPLSASAVFMLAASTAGSRAPIEAPSLDGQWISACQPIGKNGRHGFVTQVVVTGDHIEAEAQVYATAACLTPTFKLSYRGRVRHSQATAGKVVFDHLVESIVLTPQAADVATQYNQPGDGHGCGLKGWQVNIAKSVAGRRCDPFYFAAEKATLYDAAWLDGDDLRFGAFPMIWTNTSPDHRPFQPLPLRYHRTRK